MRRGTGLYRPTQDIQGRDVIVSFIPESAIRVTQPARRLCAQSSITTRPFKNARQMTRLDTIIESLRMAAARKQIILSTCCDSGFLHVFSNWLILAA
jgi:hypothetical protein